eukprot:jgi/Astpho2/5349/Aster-x1289
MNVIINGIRQAMGGPRVVPSNEAKQGFQRIEIDSKHQLDATSLTSPRKAASRRVPSTLGASRIKRWNRHSRSVDGLPSWVQNSWLVINPNLTEVRYWGLWMTVVLLFTALVTPFEISFLKQHFNALFVCNRVVDVSFILDMVLQALMGFWDKKRQRWESSLGPVLWRYCRTWLLLDIISAAPFDVVAMLLSSQTLSKFKVLRLLRLVRLAKLFRILRAGHILQRWEVKLAINYSVVQLTKSVVVVMVCAHWLACGYHLVVILESSTGANWVLAYNESIPGDEVTTAAEVYLVALGWSVQTMSTIGYGDVRPVTNAERSYAIVGMLIGASLYAYMVGSICGIVASMGAEKLEFYSLMDSLNHFMKRSRLPLPVRRRLREFLRYRRTHRSLQDYPQLMQVLSPALRAEVAASLQAKWVLLVPAFRGLSQELKTEIALALESNSYPPGEPIVQAGDKCQRMYVVAAGTVMHRGRWLMHGELLGAQLFLPEGEITWAHSARTLTFSTLISLDKETFHSLLARHPASRRAVRAFVVKAALREGLVVYARAVAHVRCHWALPGAAVLPTAASLGAGHLPDVKYTRILELLFEEWPERFGELHAAAITIQKLWRGWKARRLRQLLKLVALDRILAKRKASYTVLVEAAAQRHEPDALTAQSAGLEPAEQSGRSSSHLPESDTHHLPGRLPPLRLSGLSRQSHSQHIEGALQTAPSTFQDAPAQQAMPGDQAEAGLIAEVLRMRRDLTEFQTLLIQELNAMKYHMKDSR